ncbi:MAG: 50S ribosomal protein L23 [Clostridiales bacterium]|jgi:large subunit ribosomal protein L23|nr:50S ribosomal protein L23 [Clostridiales bacterium]
MADLKYYDILFKPLATEKTMNIMADKRYVFYVHPEANKTQIKEAVEKLFDGVKVAKVNTINYQGKKKRRRYVEGRTPARKKAYVQLTQTSNEITVFQGM